MIKVKNPILSGFYPDPSICRVGEDFYLVNSTFAYFPGVPVFHSKDLANWKQIGNVLDRNSQLPLYNTGHSGGIFAPTIRYNDGVYYMITTNIASGGNFIVTASNPAGPWSEPHYLDAPGIDPSLFFDMDGTCYYVGTRPNSSGERYGGDWEIWAQKVDLTIMKLVGESHAIWKGAVKDVIWPEGPHIYYKDNYYYVMIAEGGTGPNHAVTVARSKNVFGPYENNANNPILTHRHLGKDYPIVYVGHGDLVDDINGNWYMVTLASRRSEGYIGLGRETFLSKVVWEDGWPVVNPGIGKLEDIVELPFDGISPENKLLQTLNNFSEESYDVVTLRNSNHDFYKYENGKITLKFLPETMKDLASPAYLGFRQLSYEYEAILEIEFNMMGTSEETGLVILQSNEYHILYRIKKEFNDLTLQVVKCINSKEDIAVQKLLKTEEVKQIEESNSSVVVLKIRGYGQRADFILQVASKEIVIAFNVDVHEMSTEIAGGFVGNTIGVYASSCGRLSENYVNILNFTISY